MRKLSLFITVALFVAPFPAPLRAAFILDDFDDAAEVVSPEMEGELVPTPNVGDLSAHRNLLIFGNQSDPVARLDANITNSSMLTGQFSSFSPSDPAGSLMRFGTSYQFEAEQDFTQGGQNNAIFLRFAEISGVVRPNLLLVLADNDELFVDISSVTGPETLVLRFDNFSGRGGGPPSGDFTNVGQVLFRLFITSIEAEDPGSVFLLDRIRIGRIPEPGTIWATLFFSLILLVERRLDRQIQV